MHHHQEEIKAHRHLREQPDEARIHRLQDGISQIDMHHRQGEKEAVMHLRQGEKEALTHLRPDEEKLQMLRHPDENEEIEVAAGPISRHHPDGSNIIAVEMLHRLEDRNESYVVLNQRHRRV